MAKLFELVLIGGGVLGLALWSLISTRKSLARDRAARRRAQQQDEP